MTIKNFIILFGISFAFFGFSGCKKEEPKKENPTPFVRLLEDQSFDSKIFKRPIQYAVLLPADYDSLNNNYPVVYLLHGYGDDEKAWYKYGNIQYYVDHATETVPMIYVMPEAFNTYYVNKYNGNYPYMDMFTTELVPEIDSLFRTIPLPDQRAVMGYSMGGYGAMILPAKNPELFKTGVALSMSFRTDTQYISEPQGVFNSQWGSIFGGIDATGTSRLTDYFLSHSPFHFFNDQINPSLNGLNFFISCGDDEETLSVTSDTLHDLLRNMNYPHAYRIKNGAHSWSYWHKELPEALKYISYAVQQIPYPTNPTPVNPGSAIPSNRLVTEQLEGTNISFQVALPEGYLEGTDNYPVVIVIHNRNMTTQDEETTHLISLFNSFMTENKMPRLLVIEVPVQETEITAESLRNILNQVNSGYRILNDRNHTVLIGNGDGGRMAYQMLTESTDLFNTCLLFDANLPEDASINLTDVSIYLDICDLGINYKSYHSLYVSLRNHQADHEYRVRQGTPSPDSFLNGLTESSYYIKAHLND
ncbi:MAG: alpha/beta hydrolase family protein [Bacteroidales bacterium]|nr:alpha/beta hydrolase family protein [Bacteroidales bacterium]